MKVELKLQPGLEEAKIVIYAPEETEELRQLMEQLEKKDLSPIPALKGERTFLLPPETILRFFADGKGVCAQTAEDTYLVRLRLYELEERLDKKRFVRISNSEIVNLGKVRGFDLSFSGTIRVSLANGTSTYVSRRYVSKIKTTLGL